MLMLKYSIFLDFFLLLLFDFVLSLMHFQRNSTLLILSMGHTITEALTLGITSTNTQAMIVTIACIFLLLFSTFYHLAFCFGNSIELYLTNYLNVAFM